MIFFSNFPAMYVCENTSGYWGNAEAFRKTEVELTKRKHSDVNQIFYPYHR